MRLQMRPIGMLWPALLAAVVVALAAACGGSADTEVRPFAEIQVGEPRVEIVNEGTAAIVTVVTDVDAVCSVAFGETAALGRIATDRDMGGVGHRDHLVILNDLEPDRTYSFKFSGADADGVLYQSRDFLTFTADPAPAVGAGEGAVDERTIGRNVVAEATVVDASSEFSSGFAASMALDGDVTTEWSTAGDGDDGFVTIDLGRPVDVGGVAFRTRAMSDGSSITRTFSVVVDDGERLGPFAAGDRATSDVAAVSFTGRVLRFEIDESTGGNTGAIDLEVFERAPPETLDDAEGVADVPPGTSMSSGSGSGSMSSG